MSRSLALFLRLLFLAAGLSLPAFSASAATLGVPTQYATIQAAVSAASNGDTVLIADGTYTGPGNVDIDFGGKNITVTSQHGAASTFIDCGGSASANHRGFYLHSGETAAVISGLTIQNGYVGTAGGGIYNDTVGATVQNCVLKANAAYNGGGGIFNANEAGGTVTLNRCTITGNSTVSGNGGGIANVTYNGGSVAVINCVVSGNTSHGYGGGIDNNASGRAISLTNCVVSGNTASGNAGGISSYTTGYGTVTVTNCTLTGNSAGSVGGGVFSSAYGNAPITLINDILYGDSGGEAAYDFNETSSVTFSHCDVQNGYVGTANIAAAPKFVNAPANLYLAAGSPCLGAGTFSGAPSTTIDGQTRPNPPSVGAYEMAPNGTASTSTTLSSAPSSTLIGQIVTFTATVTAGNGGTPTGSVVFKVDGAAQTPVALTGGQASYNTSSLSGGSHVIIATYSGDATFASSTSTPLTQVVNTGNTTISLTSSANPSQYGQEISFTATVTGSNPTGTVAFTDTTSGTALGTANLYQGKAVLYASNYVATLSVGSHQISAAYSGDSANTAGTSSPLTQVITKATATLSVFASLNPTITGQSVTFTATVYGGGVGPTGAVTFIVDGVAQAPLPLNQGTQPTYKTSSLTAGSHSIAVSYSGDTNFQPGTSSTFTEIVLPHISPQYVSPAGSDGNTGTSASPKLTIQAAINATLAGDTVIVEDGTYTGPGDVDVSFGGRNLTVRSQNGPATTIINCGGYYSYYGYGDHRGFYLSSGETNAVISGLTIENGYESAGSGGGILVSNVSLTVQNCVFKNNSGIYGGGIENTTTGGQAVIVTGCTFSGNTAQDFGGGIESYSTGTFTVTGCVFLNNLVGTNGNSGFGGGIDTTNSSGGMFTATNCVFAGNQATGPGGGIRTSNNGTNGTNLVTNCTFTANTALYASGGIYNQNTAVGVVVLSNNILFGDTGGEIGGDPVTINHCDVQGGSAGTGNVNADPLFVNYPADLHLQLGSPCLGAGTAIGAPALTIDERTRPNPPSIGAYEIYVAPTAVTVANASGTAGQTVTLSAALGNPGGAGLSGRTLSFSVDGAAAGTAVTNSAGTAALPYAIPAGTTVGGHALSASFAGDMTNSASSGIGTLTVAAAGPVPASQARFAPRVGWGSRMVGGKFQGSSDGVSYTTLATITQAPPDNQLTTLTFASPAAYRFLRYLAPNGAYGNISELEFDSGTGASAAKISGTPFGTPGSWANQGNDFTKAFDGSTSTYFDAPDPGNGDFVGIDQGSATPNQVRYFPRVGWESRMVGGKFQGSSDGVTYTTLATVTQAPGDAYTTVPLSVDPAAYRFLRYLAPNGAYGNIAELEFDSQGKKLTGTAFGTAGSYAGSGNDFTKVFDGTTSTFFDAPSPGNGDFAGIDQGAGVTALGEVHFTPRAAWASRMVGGRFQGSADGVTYTDLAAIGPAPPDGQQTVTMLAADPKSYRFLRYLAPDGAYGNIAELAFYSGTGASAVKIGGTPFGTPGSYANSGNDFTKAFDGNVSTYFDAPSPGNGDFAGIDQGAP